MFDTVYTIADIRATGPCYDPTTVAGVNEE